MKKLYLVALFVLLSVAMVGQAEAAQAQHRYEDAGIAGDCIPNNTQTVTEDDDATQDCDQLQLRERDRDQTCDGDCDGDQQQDRDRDRDRIHQAEYTPAQLSQMYSLLEQLRETLRKMYGWQ